MPRRLRRAPSQATPAPVVQATATEFRRAHCPVCGHQVGRLRVTVPGKPHLVVEYHNPWEAPRPGVDGQRPFGIILQSSGNAGIQVVGYFEPDDDPDGFFPLVKARMIEAVQDWRSKGYITLGDFGPEPEAITPITPEPRVPPGAPLPPSEVVHVPPARPRARTLTPPTPLTPAPAPAPRRAKGKETPVEGLEKAVRAFVPRIDALKKQAKPTRAALDRVMTGLTNLRDRVADQVETSTGDRRNQLQALLLRLDQAFPAVREAEAALERQNLTAWSKALDRLRECCT